MAQELIWYLESEHGRPAESMTEPRRGFLSTPKEGIEPSPAAYDAIYEEVLDGQESEPETRGRR